MVPWRKPRLAAQFNLLTIALILATSLGITFFLVRQEVRNNRGELERYGRDIAAMMAQNSEYGLYTRDQRTLRRVLEGIDSNPDLVYAAFLDVDKRLLRSREKSPLVPVPGVYSGRNPATAGEASLSF
jgi:uncharacterized membrane protein affecting hemolysin expression